MGFRPCIIVTLHKAVVNKERLKIFLELNAQKSYNDFRFMYTIVKRKWDCCMATYKKRVEAMTKLKEEVKKAEEEKLHQKYRGVFEDKKSGTWAFRLSVKIDGIGKKDTIRTGFPSAFQASRAREELRYEWTHMTVKSPNEKDYSKTFTDVYSHYKKFRAKEKRQGTIRRQDSLWKHHIEPKFGNLKLAEVSKSDLYNYLLQLYMEGDTYNNFKTGYSYAYVEGFLKFFWLIYGYAYDNNWVDTERYTKDFLNKTTKLTMPKEVNEEEDEANDIQIYTQEEIDKIRSVMKDGNLYISFLICYHCGLRISECMGLMWQDFDMKEHTLNIRRQLLYDYDDKIMYLGPPKTKKGRRTVNVPDTLYTYLIEYKAQQEKFSKVRGYKNTEKVLDRNGKGKEIEIIGGPFIQRKENGELITINSVKYWTDKVKKETGVDFHFHALRHTNASMLAARNIPVKTLADHLGHANINVAEKYYVTSTDLAKQRLKEALNDIE